MFEKYYNLKPKNIDEKLISLKEINSGKKFKNKEINYFDEFSIINLDLKKTLIIKKYNKNVKENNECIINLGRIIIILDYYPAYQILIGSLDNESNYKTLSFIKFDNANILKNEAQKLKNIDYNAFQNQLKKNKNKIFDSLNTREVGELFILDENNNETSNSGNLNMKETPKKDIIDYLIELYISFNTLINYIKDSTKTFKSQENYYLINKQWINYLNICYDYDQIINAINSNEKARDIVKKYNSSIEIEFDSKDIKDISSEIPDEIKNGIKNKDKKYDYNNLFESFEKYINEDNKEILYYDDCILINENIKNILVNITGIKDKFGIDVNCFIDYNQIILLYKKKCKSNENYLIIKGNINKNNNIFKTNVIILLDSYDFYEYFSTKLIIRGEVPQYLNHLRESNEKTKIIYNDEKQRIGIALLVDRINKNLSQSQINNEKDDKIKLIIKVLLN